ncbi:5-formyltetrahydrofolate cyclo-ligase [Fructobacillus parabroussonetiae]|uniref:5-formyltetrahydrofolate cyclo-ligase n=1 Tax=Fructobacillus parabroussonetiae TaxID=2713174 RepID=A0ABS5QWB2_9LACO|nr:5-formyltetrahydrofolate cyclo-ligase [Fructobacillus parabroussonetiae]MBS9337493.1 5-formyltetrahydrofolate cyclo-ligase [Fructobacillus parabroussonetiae]MCK8617022.1 5-formyltetrahydrofolate cyclo-ligase [Fructobacillus parabroussonetiae]
MTVRISKKACRLEQKERLLAFARNEPEAKRLEEEQLYRQLFDSEAWRTAHVVALTMAMPLELSTKPLIAQALHDGKVVAVATMQANRQLTFIQVDQQTAWQAPNAFGIVEPKNGEAVPLRDIELMLVPALAFDVTTGQRLGFGAGYYDRLLARFDGMTIGLALSKQQRSDWVIDDFDQPVKKIMTIK